MNHLIVAIIVQPSLTSHHLVHLRYVRMVGAPGGHDAGPPDGHAGVVGGGLPAVIVCHVSICYCCARIRLHVI